MLLLHIFSPRLFCRWRTFFGDSHLFCIDYVCPCSVLAYSVTLIFSFFNNNNNYYYYNYSMHDVNIECSHRSLSWNCHGLVMPHSHWVLSVRSHLPEQEAVSKSSDGTAAVNASTSVSHIRLLIQGHSRSSAMIRFDWNARLLITFNNSQCSHLVSFLRYNQTTSWNREFFYTSWTFITYVHLYVER